MIVIVTKEYRKDSGRVVAVGRMMQVTNEKGAELIAAGYCEAASELDKLAYYKYDKERRMSDRDE